MYTNVLRISVQNSGKNESEDHPTPIPPWERLPSNTTDGKLVQISTSSDSAGFRITKE